MRSARALLGLVIAVSATCVFACFPSFSFVPDVTDGGGEGGSDATSGGDGTTADGGGGDAPSDGPAFDANIVTSTLTGNNAQAYAVGYGSQVHLVYAQNDHRYWLFYSDAAASTMVKTRVSSDFATWSNGASLSIGTPLQDGYGFSVAYANLNGNDVIHIVANTNDSGSYATVHVRAKIAGGNISAGAPLTLLGTQNGGSCDVDGPSTVITADGHVWDATAWSQKTNTTCDANMYQSDFVDNGTSWPPGFTQRGYYVVIPAYTYAHQLVDMPEAGAVLATWPDHGDEAPKNVVTDFHTIGWALSTTFPGGDSGVDQDVNSQVFNAMPAFASYNDWAICRLSDQDVHAVRHVYAAGSSVSPFQHMRFDGASWLSPSTLPPNVTSLSNSGVALVSDGNPAHGLLLATLAVDGSIHIFKWTAANSGTWSDVKTIPAGAGQRWAISGSGCGTPHAQILWTEGNGPYTIFGADVTSLLQP